VKFTLLFPLDETPLRAQLPDSRVFPSVIPFVFLRSNDLVSIMKSNGERDLTKRERERERERERDRGERERERREAMEEE
jgi:hypothetical protein